MYKKSVGNDNLITAKSESEWDGPAIKGATAVLVEQKITWLDGNAYFIFLFSLFYLIHYGIHVNRYVF